MRMFQRIHITERWREKATKKEHFRVVEKFPDSSPLGLIKLLILMKPSGTAKTQKSTVAIKTKLEKRKEFKESVIFPLYTIDFCAHQR